MDTYDRSAVDLANEEAAWTHVVRQVGTGKDVLDLGCWDGLLLETLAKHAGCRGVGIERNADAAARARARGIEVVEADLDADPFADRLGGRRFDVAILADVLEHVLRPVELLRTIVDRCLRPGGHLVLSVPNVAHGSIRLALLLGDFEYTETGILDRTHLHFWTRRGLHAVLRDAGLKIDVERPIDRPLAIEVAEKALADAGFPSPVLAEFLTRNVESRTFQWVLSARRAPAAEIPAPPPAAGRDALRVGDRAMRRQAEKIVRLEERVRVLEGKSPFRWIRYLGVRWRQRRERRRAERANG
jgi:methionine biosynthesis protein MetW